MEEKKQLGGKRRGAGRKSVLDKAVQISLYVKGSKIIKFGNEEKMKTHLYGVIDSFGQPPNEAPVISIQDLTHHTSEIKPITDVKPQTNVVYTVLPEKSNMSEYAAYETRIRKATMTPELEQISRELKSALMTPREKLMLENLAKELSRDMFTD